MKSQLAADIVIDLWVNRIAIYLPAYQSASLLAGGDRPAPF